MKGTREKGNQTGPETKGRVYKRRNGKNWAAGPTTVFCPKPPTVDLGQSRFNWAVGLNQIPEV